jgi:hypothetical protein
VARARVWRGGPIVLAGYGAGLAWLLADHSRPVHASLDPGARAIIAFLLPTAAAVVLWAFHSIELARPVCQQAPGDRRATARAVIHIVTFVVAVHSLVLCQLLGSHWTRAWGLQAAFVLIGSVLVSVGNLLPATRPNLFVGVRTRRTLRDRDLWIATNRMAGGASVALGLVMIGNALALQSGLLAPLNLMAAVAVVAFVALRYRSMVQSGAVCSEDSR